MTNRALKITGIFSGMLWILILGGVNFGVLGWVGGIILDIIIICIWATKTSELSPKTVAIKQKQYVINPLDTSILVVLTGGIPMIVNPKSIVEVDEIVEDNRLFIIEWLRA
ncbi:MAG: hypothetical protein FWF56_04200 [Firmicutes bacterium]|nr:hypothetical protein [Bacillota bacterium]MCL1953757.1 hypothetical protein [Bacillota bacterium]